MIAPEFDNRAKAGRQPSSRARGSSSPEGGRGSSEASARSRPAVTLVVDASVVVKWLLADPAREADTSQAERLMASVLEGGEAILQPVHWLIEVAAVLTRMSPATAEHDVERLQALELPIDEGAAVLARACRLAIDLEQHLFDTLYHAVALETLGATLVTANAKYLAAGARLGSIMPLAEWAPAPAKT